MGGISSPSPAVLKKSNGASKIGRGGSNVAADLTAVEQAISDEVTARGDADTALSQAIADEATARGDADTALSQAIADEATARGDAEATLAQAIADEATTRGDADEALGQQIADLPSSVYEQIGDTIVIDNDAFIDVVGLGAFQKYEIHLIDIVPQSESYIGARYSTNNGASFQDAGVYSYSITTNGSVSLTTANMGPLTPPLDNAGAETGYSFVLTLTGLSSATKQKYMYSVGGGRGSSAFLTSQVVVNCPVTEAINAVRILANSGNIVSGLIKVYGVS